MIALTSTSAVIRWPPTVVDPQRPRAPVGTERDAIGAGALNAASRSLSNPSTGEQAAFRQRRL
jgi:hypothetical protein